MELTIEQKNLFEMDADGIEKEIARVKNILTNKITAVDGGLCGTILSAATRKTGDGKYNLRFAHLVYLPLIAKREGTISKETNVKDPVTNQNYMTKSIVYSFELDRKLFQEHQDYIQEQIRQNSVVCKDSFQKSLLIFLQVYSRDKTVDGSNFADTTLLSKTSKNGKKIYEYVAKVRQPKIIFTTEEIMKSYADGKIDISMARYLLNHRDDNDNVVLSVYGLDGIEDRERLFDETEYNKQVQKLTDSEREFYEREQQRIEYVKEWLGI